MTITKWIIRINPDADTRDLDDYLGKRGTVKTDRGYQVASGLTKDEAGTALCDLSTDMLWDFDAEPSHVFSWEPGVYEFANQFGKFYIDNCTE